MLIGRRAFLSGIAASTLLRALPARGQTQLFSGAPVTFGKVNLGLNGISTTRPFSPFVNWWKSSDYKFSQISAVSGNYFANTAPGLPLCPWGVYFDPTTGELINPQPADSQTWFRLFFGPLTFGYTAAELPATGTQFVLKWDGTATGTLSGLTPVTSSSNRVVGSWPASLTNFLVRFSITNVNDPPRNIRLGLLANEALLDAGVLFDPTYLAQVKHGAGVVRFMDWMATNNNLSSRTYADIPTEAFYSWGVDSTQNSGAANPQLKNGMPPSVMVKMANQSQSHPWVCIPSIFGTAKIGWVSAITAANPAVVTAPGNNFVNGDQVIPYVLDGMARSATVTIDIPTSTITWTAHNLVANQGVTPAGGTLPTGLVAGQLYFVVGSSLTTNTFQLSVAASGAAITLSGTQTGTHTAAIGVNRNTFTVANVNAGAGTFELSGPGSDTTGFSTYHPNLSQGYLTSKYSLASITTELTTLATQFRDGVDGSLLTHWELGNELWNSLFNSFHWLGAQARGQFAGDSSYRMTGYLAAHCMKTIRDVYGVSNRARWKGILGTQTSNPAVTTEIIAGVNQYISDQGLSLTITDLFDYIAVTGYFGNLFPNSPLSPGNATLDTIATTSGSATFTKANNGLINNNPITFASPPTPFVANTIYYVVNQATNTFQLAATVGGSPITVTQTGSFTATWAAGDWSLALINTSISLFNGGQEPTRYSYYNRILNADILDGSYSGTPFNINLTNATAWVPQKAIAVANGLGIIQYEGGNSNDIRIAFSGPNSALYAEFFPQGNHTPEDAANQTASFTQWAALGGVFPSKFTDACPISQFGSFCAQWNMPDNNPTWNAVVSFNGR